MSVETMSPGPAVAISAGIAAPSAPPFGGEFSRGIGGMAGNFDPGGSYQPDLNGDLFSQTQELRVSSPVQTFDKNIGEVAFSHTINNSQLTIDDVPTPISTPAEPPAVEISHELLPVQQTETLHQVLSEEAQKEIQAPEIKTEEISEALNDESPTNQTAISEKPSMLSSIERSELKADFAQAERVKEALIAIGTPEKEAEKSAVETLAKTEQRKSLSIIHNETTATTETQKQDEALKKELSVSEKFSGSVVARGTHFEHDAKTDAKRREVAQKTIAEVAKDFEEGKIKEVTGKTIAERLPAEPQPEEVISELLKETRGKRDGSYREAIEELKSEGTIYSADEALRVVDKILNSNHAVKVNRSGASNSATEQEVRKVLSY